MIPTSDTEIAAIRDQLAHAANQLEAIFLIHGFMEPYFEMARKVDAVVRDLDAIIEERRAGIDCRRWRSAALPGRIHQLGWSAELAAIERAQDDLEPPLR
jgi:hypothetical protein